MSIPIVFTAFWEQSYVIDFTKTHNSAIKQDMKNGFISLPNKYFDQRNKHFQYIASLTAAKSHTKISCWRDANEFFSRRMQTPTMSSYLFQAVQIFVTPDMSKLKSYLSAKFPRPWQGLLPWCDHVNTSFIKNSHGQPTQTNFRILTVWYSLLPLILLGLYETSMRLVPPT